jgi:hypothetical protein
LSSLKRGVVESLGAQGGDEDAEESVTEGAECAGMTVPAATLSSVEGLASVVVLNAGTGPMVDGVAKTWITGAAHEDDSAFTAPAGDGSESGVSAERVVVSFGERLRSLREHRGADESSRAWKREKDLDVAMLPTFTFRRYLTAELLKHIVDPLATVSKLLAGELESGQQKLSMLGGGLESTWGELEALLSQGEAELLGGDAADSMLSQDAGELIFSQPTREVRGWSLEEQSPQPRLVRAGRELEELREESMQLSPELVGEAPEFFVELRVDPAQLSESNDEWLIDAEFPEMVDIGAKRVRQDEGIEAVVLGAGHGMAVAEAVELLGIDGIDVNATLEQGFDDGAVGQLDGDGTSNGLRVAMLEKRIDETVDSHGGMLDAKFGQFTAVLVEQTDLVELTAIVDAGEQNIGFAHSGSTSSCEIRSAPRCRIAPVPALWAQLPTGRAPRLPRRDAGPPQALLALGPHVAFPAGRPVVTSWVTRRMVQGPHAH